MQRLENHPRPVVVDIWAPWCMPCRMISPLLERLGREYAGKVDVWKINADDHPGLVQSLGVIGIPTLIVYRDSQEIARRTGAQPQSKLAELFEMAITGELPVKQGLALPVRLLRGVTGVVLLALGLTTGPSLILLVAGAIVAFSAVYDRCPVWQALVPRIRQTFSKIQDKEFGRG